jgi:hypothetical protein
MSACAVVSTRVAIDLAASGVMSIPSSVELSGWEWDARLPEFVRNANRKKETSSLSCSFFVSASLACCPPCQNLESTIRARKIAIGMKKRVSVFTAPSTCFVSNQVRVVSELLNVIAATSALPIHMTSHHVTKV